MSPEAQRIAIAEACGEKDPHWWCPLCLAEKSPHQVTYEENCTVCGRRVEWFETPDYLNDLNACHEMEKVLDQAKLGIMHSFLEEIGERDVEKILGHRPTFCFLWTATAGQRSEAFLKTLGLWVESDESGTDAESHKTPPKSPAIPPTKEI